MTIQEAMNTAVAGGYHVQDSDGGATSYSGDNSEFSLWTRTDNVSSFCFVVAQGNIAHLQVAGAQATPMLNTPDAQRPTHSPGGRRMRRFLVTIEFEYTSVDEKGTPSVRTGSLDFVEQAASPLAAEEQARAAFAATAKGTIITVSVRAQNPPN
jgi:hypothetical protein